jgi:tRNA (guanine6-N2)-methyltransferase
MTGLSFVARCIHGLEWVVAAEIEGRGLGAVASVGHREVRFATEGLPAAPALQLRTADDVWLVCAEAMGIDQTRASLARLTAAARSLPLPAALALRDQIAPGGDPDTLTVVASFLGRRNYNRYEIEAAVTAGLAPSKLRVVGSQLLSRHSRVLTLRAHLVEQGALLALRIFEQPLHRRGYRTHSHPGALHPPVAAALAALAGLRPGLRLLDPFCGVGTIPLEARLLEPAAQVVGGDLAPERLASAAANRGAAAAQVSLLAADATRLPFADAGFDAVVSNLPWGRQVELVGGGDGPLPAAVPRELARVLRAGGRAVLLVQGEAADPDPWQAAGLVLQLRARLSLFGQHPELWILSSGGAPAVDSGQRWGPQLARHLPLADQI